MPVRTSALRSLGAHLNALQAAGGSTSTGRMIQALFDLASTAALVDAYERLTQETYAQQLAATQDSSLAFTDRMFSCAPHGGENVVRSGESCMWARMDMRDLKRDSTPQQKSYHQGATAFSGGIEAGLGAGWRAGWGLSYETANMDTADQQATGSGDRVQGGVVVKKDAGAAELALAVTGGKASFSTLRAINFGGAEVANGRQRLSFGSLSLRAGRTYGAGTGWIRPSIEVVGTDVHTNAFHETGAGGLNLQSPAQTQQYWRVRPSLEAGRDFKLGEDLWLRAALKAGVNQVITGRASTLEAGFEGDTPGLQPFAVRSLSDSTMAETGLSLSVVNSKGASVRLGFNGQYGKTTTEMNGQFKVILPF